MEKEDNWKTIINSFSCGCTIIELKKKLILNTRVFVKIFNWQNRKLVYKTHKIVELEKYQISKAKNPLNLNDQKFYKIFEVL